MVSNYMSIIKSKITQIKPLDIILLVISIIGFGVRIYGFGSIPPGLNQDEASIGYDAFAIMNYGLDRNGSFLPIHLIAWGSGQNALYAYLSMPFIWILGLSPFSIRLLNLVLGLLSMFVFYKLVKRVTNKEIAVTAFFLLAINPWHIMLCRWALESNIFPAIFLIGVYLLVLSFEKKKYLPVSFFFIALSLYSYGVSYFFVPIFMMISVTYLLYYRKISLKNFLFSSLVFAVTAAPIFIFVLVNYLKLDAITTPFFTIPRLTGDAQFMTQSSIFNADFLNNAKDNFLFFLKYLVKQEDVIWNVMPKYGYMYLFSLPLALLGLIRILMYQFSERKFKKVFVIIIWFFTSVLMTFAVEICTNRINIIFFPIIIFTSLGIFYLKNKVKELPFVPILLSLYIVSYSSLSFNNTVPKLLILSVPIILFGVINLGGSSGNKRVGKILEKTDLAKAELTKSDLTKSTLEISDLAKSALEKSPLTKLAFVKTGAAQLIISVTVLYLVFFSLFTSEYIKDFPMKVSSIYYESFGEAIQYASQNNKGLIFVTDTANMPYIFVLFYTRENPKEFIETVEYLNPGSSFQNVRAFGRYRFDKNIPDNSTENGTENGAFVVHNSDIGNFENGDFKIKRFKNYSVAMYK